MAQLHANHKTNHEFYHCDIKYGDHHQFFITFDKVLQI